MCDPNFNADFFNNVAAIAVVLIFTKVFTNRSRKATKPPNHPWLVSLLHVCAVVIAAVAIGISLWATGYRCSNAHREIAAAVILALTAGLLIADIVIEEFSPKWPPRWPLGKPGVSEKPPVNGP
jgi:uncharacterized membrane protein